MDLPILRQQDVLDSFDRSQMELYILPTEKCNFRCTYCYEDFKLGRMSPQVISAVNALLSHRASSLRSLVIGWFGGEPLLGLSAMRMISSHIQSLSLANPALKYHAHLTTNGSLLTFPVFEELVSLGVRRFQISLDGLASEHNETRRRADGGATFDRVMVNLQATRSSDRDFEVVLRLHFQANRLDRVERLIPHVVDQFGHDTRYKIYFKQIERLGGERDHEIANVPHAQAVMMAEHLNTLIPERMVMRISEPERPYICYASKPNSFVIRANGELAKCTVAFNDDRNRVGKLNDDGTVEINQDKFRLWAHGFQSLNLDELACPLALMRSN